MYKELFQNFLQLRFSLLYVVVILLVAANGCDESFEPREENTKYYFTMYGYLDASIDTQWVRLAPVRDTFDPTLDQIDVTVTIRNIDSGESAIMNDSLFNPNDLAIYWNFWTDLPISPGETYEILARRPDGIESSVRITVPEDFATPVFAQIEGRDYLLIDDVDRLADVQTIWLIYEPFRGDNYVFTFSHIEDSVDSFVEGQRKIEINAADDERLLDNYFGDISYQVMDRQIFIASAGPDWVNVYELDDNIYTLPEGISNVNNGVGFVFGTITKTIPWQSCFRTENGVVELAACDLERRIDEDDL